MPQEVMGPAQDRPSPVNSATVKQPDAASLFDACSVYMILLVGRSGAFLRKPYLSLHSAQQALQRAQDRGQPAHLVFCKLEPVTVADLDDVVGS